jgi:hypothetical protein
LSFSRYSIARAQALDHAARHSWRLRKAPALIDDLRVQFLAARTIALPKSTMDKTATLAL